MITVPVEKQFAAYNARDLEAFIACFADDFTAWRMPASVPSMQGKAELSRFYAEQRFNNAELRAVLISRTVLGDKVFDHEKIYGLQPEPLESIAVFQVADGLIQTAWFWFS